eukprot:CAMPEP_0175867560 /NCGR_PEP_ID=MMETSP0107_2-20121207/34886_1 /TAXON_ID=195067 ORGANISM="Goniomonas pacifica, Strain CCMP1869" /NCGR_SAMPLE_ID=MMETSP0107_2 /ASSEMBLY_ACC=CAM_ASM_000203 /LENGTH=34 /DNA_ID= /DNA_START= /DNA_END= /DNA_ORIENTATION=
MVLGIPLLISCLAVGMGGAVGPVCTGRTAAVAAA